MTMNRKRDKERPMVKKLVRTKSLTAVLRRDLRGCLEECLEVVEGRRELAHPPPPRREENAIGKRRQLGD